MGRRRTLQASLIAVSALAMAAAACAQNAVADFYRGKQIVTAAAMNAAIEQMAHASPKVSDYMKRLMAETKGG